MPVTVLTEASNLTLLVELNDRQGRPMFLAAENSRFGGAQSVLALQRLTGVCPTCGPVTPDNTARVDVGTLLRRLEGGTLHTIELDAIWGESPEEAWSVVDRVQSLGGPNAMQGCAP